MQFTSTFENAQASLLTRVHRPIRLTQCCTQFKSPGNKILCVLYLHYNVAKRFIPKGFELGKTLSWPNRSIDKLYHWH